MEQRILRVGCAAGFSGDRTDAALPVVQALKAAGGPAVLIFETLAERTLALAQLARRNDPDAGYEPLLDDMLRPKSAGGRNWKASMAQDVAKGRATEIDYMNGFVVASGREKSIPTPVSAAVVETIHEVERGQRKQAAENIGVTLKRAGL